MTVLSADFLCFYLQVGLSFARFAAVVAVLDDERRPGFSRMPNVTNDLHPRRAFYPELSLAYCHTNTTYYYRAHSYHIQTLLEKCQAH